MLDKSVPYKRIIMRLDYNKNNFKGEVVLPKGYSFKMYEPGMEVNWAETETEVLEYNTKEVALSYFQKELIPYQELLRERMVFILSPEGNPVANACAWYVNYKGKHQAHVHFVGVRPEYQGIGLGKAIFLKILSIFPEVEPGEDIYLHTQTWSHKAVRMYLNMGFKLIKDETIGYYDKNRDEAIEVLDQIYDEETMRQIRGNRYSYRVKRLLRNLFGGS